MARHIIHQQKVTIQVPKSANAHFYQDRVSDLLQNQLPQQIETLLDEIFPSDKIVRIDSLRLDLGNLSAQDFEREFKAEFIRSLAKTLSSKKEVLNAANNEEVLNKAQSLVQSFIYFLEKGRLPWYHPAANMVDWEKELLMDLSAREYDHFLDWLKDNYQNPVIIERLVLQFSDLMLAKLMSAIAPLVNEPWELICRDYALILSQLGRRWSAGRNEIWRALFGVLLRNKDKTWAYNVLKLLGNQTALAASGIMAGKKTGIASQLKTVAVHDAFGELTRVLKPRKDTKSKSLKRGKATGDTTLPLAEPDDNGKELAAGWSHGKKQKWDVEEDSLYVNNSGTVILHHFLKPFFEDLELLADGKFVSEKAHQRAVFLLYYLATGEAKVAEFELPLQKILCGYPLENTLPASIRLSRKEKEESHKLLKTVIDYWPPLKGTSLEGLRGTFLRRDGKLVKNDNGWLLTVEQKTVDVLLGKLPWGFSTIRLSWMEQILNVDWY